MCEHFAFPKSSFSYTLPQQIKNSFFFFLVETINNEIFKQKGKLQLFKNSKSIFLFLMNSTEKSNFHTLNQIFKNSKFECTLLNISLHHLDKQIKHLEKMMGTTQGWCVLFWTNPGGSSTLHNSSCMAT